MYTTYVFPFIYIPTIDLSTHNIHLFHQKRKNKKKMENKENDYKDAQGNP